MTIERNQFLFVHTNRTECVHNVIFAGIWQTDNRVQACAVECQWPDHRLGKVERNNLDSMTIDHSTHALYKGRHQNKKKLFNSAGFTLARIFWTPFLTN